MKDIKLIALDLDGTTLNSKSELTPRTIAALESAIERGVHVVIATGRPFTAVPAEVKAIKNMEYMCTSNGAEIYNMRTGKLVYSNYIAPHAIEDIIRILSPENFMVEVFVHGVAYTDAASYNMAVEGNLTIRNQKYIIETRNPVDDIFEFMMEHRDSIENINVNFFDLDDKARMKDILDSIEDTTLTSAFLHNWELGGATTSKADALREICRRLNLTSENIMAAGDSPNDSAMLSLAGLPVAVGNAKDVIKEMAAYVTGTNDEDGVAQAIEKFVLI